MDMPSDERQAILDQEHLRLLAIFYYIRAVTTALIAMIPMVHVILGFVLIGVGQHVTLKPGEPSPALFGWLFVGIGLTVVAVGWLFAVLQFLAGRSIARRRHRVFCYVIAALNCFAIPYGTAVGVMTFIVLSRPSVVRLF